MYFYWQVNARFLYFPKNLCIRFCNKAGICQRYITITCWKKIWRWCCWETVIQMKKVTQVLKRYPWYTSYYILTSNYSALVYLDDWWRPFCCRDCWSLRHRDQLKMKFIFDLDYSPFQCCCFFVPNNLIKPWYNAMEVGQSFMDEMLNQQQKFIFL